MNDFESKYLYLLRTQVEAEIAYLAANGHEFNPVVTPCMFCYRNRDGQYSCGRIHQLRQFAAQIESHKGRTPSNQGKAFGSPSSQELPLMFPGMREDS